MTASIRTIGSDSTKLDRDGLHIVGGRRASLLRCGVVGVLVHPQSLSDDKGSGRSEVRGSSSLETGHEYGRRVEDQVGAHLIELRVAHSSCELGFDDIEHLILDVVEHRWLSGDLSIEIEVVELDECGKPHFGAG